jgi:hypothetical protein
VSVRHREGPAHQIASSATLEVLTGEEGKRLGAFAPAYGRIEEAACVRGHSAGPLPYSVLTFVPAAEGQHAIAIEPLAIDNRPAAAWHAAAFRVRLDDIEMVVLGSVDRTDEGAAKTGPGGSWGCRSAGTDGRIALLVHRAGDPVEAIVIDGSQVDGELASLNLKVRTPIARVALMPSPAHP